MSMEIVNVDARTWAKMASRIGVLNEKLGTLIERVSDKGRQQWLDNQEVCELLNISKRTLQTYRDNGVLTFSQINHKNYYRPQDLQELLARLKETE
ncbi:MAG: helix-turn-helix domain-containing protein [Rikenellaceae bacterium]